MVDSGFCALICYDMTSTIVRLNQILTVDRYIVYVHNNSYQQYQYFQCLITRLVEFRNCSHIFVNKTLSMVNENYDSFFGTMKLPHIKYKSQCIDIRFVEMNAHQSGWVIANQFLACSCWCVFVSVSRSRDLYLSLSLSVFLFSLFLSFRFYLSHYISRKQTKIFVTTVGVH